jgi:hypothetical protein
VCQKTILDTTISALGENVTGYSLFDTGTAEMQISTPAGSNFPADIPPQSAGFSYSYTAGTGYFTTVVEPDTTTVNIIGIGYFTTSTEGWK